MKIVVVSGGFDPIHSGHIAYFKAAKLLGDKLVVAVNSDQWLINKKSKFFMPFSERANIILNLGVVDEVIDFEDDEHGSCALGLKKIKSQYPDDEIIFCNGGDRKKGNIHEMHIKDITFKFGVGGDNKLNSSSIILKNWNYESEKRVWGKFYNLFEDKGLKLKELILEPHKKMSFQRHFKRNEIWFISKGSCEVQWSETAPENQIKVKLNTEEVFHVKVGNWHQIINPFDVPCHIIEIQYGEETTEKDIERLA
jgi:cytidyltransferase-like protein